jgi:DNA polymerase-1
MDRAIILDADIVAYKVATVCQTDIDWGNVKTRDLEPQKALRTTDEVIAGYCEALDTDLVVVAFTDEVNFRTSVYPDYKSNRKDTERPELLDYVKRYMASDYLMFKKPQLEADDCMGILATHDKIMSRYFERPVEAVMVSEDKDMRTVPGKLYNPNRTELGIIDISVEDANRFHMYQTIVGDPVDGYGGAWRVGPKSEFVTYLMEDAVPAEFWDVVLEAYASRGATEEDALVQARCAHILWASSYDFQNKEPRLWEPHWLQDCTP